MSFQIEHNILKKYIEENGVTEIGERAFRNCQSLTSIHIPDSVTKIGICAFYYCKNLISIHLPDGVTEIGYCAFYRCKNLISIHIPDGVTEIGKSAFYDCEHLTNIRFPESMTEIGTYAFYDCEQLTSVHFPENIAYIGEHAFLDCGNLATVLINMPILEHGEKLQISLVPDRKWNDVPLMEQIQMLRTRNFSVEMKAETKYLLLCRFLVLCPELPELVAYMKEHFEEIFAFAVKNNQIKAIFIMLNWNLLNQENIDLFIRLAIENTQKTGNPEIQLLLTEYKYKHIEFTSIEDKFKL